MDRSHSSHLSASALQSHTTLPEWTDGPHPLRNNERHYRPGRYTESKIKLLDQVRIVLRLKHMSLKTEDTYVAWSRRFLLCHRKRHPKERGAPESRALLAPLAVHEPVAASTQPVALNALLCLYRHVLPHAFPD